MLKRKFFIFSFFIFFFSLSFLMNFSVTFSEKVDVTVITTDLNEPYEIVGFVFARSGSPDLSKINDDLKEQAEKMDADYLIGVRYVIYAGYIYGYGTAVKTKQLTP